MAKDTRRRLMAAALDLFSTDYYDVVSVAQICRTAGVSNGVFYRYFHGKEEIFQELLDEFLDQFSEELLAIQGESGTARLTEFVRVVSQAAYRYAGQVTMFREGQYRHPEYEEHLRAIYIKSVESVLRRRVTEAEYLYLLSGLRFLSTRSRFHHIPVNDALLLDMLLEGVFKQAPTLSLVGGATPAVPQEPALPRDSGEQMVEAGLRLFGRDGYFAVQVSDIVREAGFSVGTFYNRFDSKEQFLAEVVHQIGRRTRHYLTEHAVGSGNRLDREIAGMWNFLGYFGHHPEYYSIVREAEFVVPMAVKEYYDAFERGYVHSLTEYPEEKRPVVANFLMGLSHYLGIEVLFSNRVIDPHTLVHELGSLLGHGVSQKQEITQ